MAGLGHRFLGATLVAVLLLVLLLSGLTQMMLGEIWRDAGCRGTGRKVPDTTGNQVSLLVDTALWGTTQDDLLANCDDCRRVPPLILRVTSINGHHCTINYGFFRRRLAAVIYAFPLDAPNQVTYEQLLAELEALVLRKFDEE